ncbi:MAG: FAD-dependent oxidoreductase [Candidatus Zambryskibacteria bacterium]|nr:FAD-dependent oxidoreductase [Candidatus Zambryskibacteria bacterium]
MYDLVIIGGGPAGVAAGVYAARKQIKTALFAESFGGQSVESNEIQNWIGTTTISGIELANNLKEHVKFYANGFVDIKEGEKIEEITRSSNGFEVITQKGSYKTKTILIASGSRRRKLDIPGAKEFEGRGITYCASCDGPFFKDKDVVVIGGGNAGFETAAELLAYCKSVTLLEVGEFHADPVTIKKVLENPKMKALTNAMPTEVKGDESVKSLTYKKTAPFVDIVEIEVEGIFVEIGHVPATDFAKDIGVEMDEYECIKIDYKNQRTNIEGIWAAGDCTNIPYHQNNIAAGDAVKALEDIYQTLQKMK